MTSIRDIWPHFRFHRGLSQAALPMLLVCAMLVGASSAAAAVERTATSSNDRLAQMVDHQIELIDLRTDEVGTLDSSLSVDSVALSPGGTEVAANESGSTSAATGKYASSLGLFLISADAGAAKRLTSGDDTDPAWSPDGQWIAFVRGEARPPIKDQGLYVIRPNGTGLHLVRKGFVSTPTWSPDGKQLAFDYWTTSGWDSANADWRRTTDSLAVISRSGGSLHKLTSHSWTEAGQPTDDTAPAWSPDGSEIAFQRTLGRGDNDGSFVYVIKPNGTGLSRITPAGYFAEPTGWSPDSSELGDWQSKICKSCSAGLGAPKAWISTLTSLRSTAVGGFSSVTWSPGGELVGFGCSAAASGICVIGPDGTVTRTISGTPPASSSTQKVQGIVAGEESAVTGRTHTYNITQLATDSRTGETVNGVHVIKVTKASLGTATHVGSSSIRYTAPKGINNKKVLIHFVASVPGDSAPVPGVLILLILGP